MNTNTAENILPFPSTSVPDTDLLQFIDDAPMQQLVMSRPFFKASLPITPIGINKSYKPVELNGKASLAHKREAKLFLEDASLILSCQEYGQMLDWDLFRAISKSKRRVPIAVEMTFYFESQASDIDGPIKITLDALFNHFKKVAEPDFRVKWNDNRVKHLDITKEVDADCPRILIEVRCLIQTTLGRAA